MPLVPHAALNSVLHLPAWNVRRGHGSFLTMEFGAPEPETQWHLWIYQCAWSLVQNAMVRCHSESEPAAIEAACARLEGQSLKQIVAEAGALTSFVFTGGAVITTRPYADEKTLSDTWIFYAPGGRTVALQSDGTLTASAEL